MKIRNGFVSNSSSSSFIVQVQKSFINNGPDWIASQDDIEKITDYGFGATSVGDPHNYKDPYCKKCEDEGDSFPLDFMGFFVVCNEEEVLDFLVENDIPFKASCHYDQQYYEYKKGGEFILSCYNYGQDIGMYGYKEFEDDISFYPKDPIKKIPKSEFLS